MAPDHAGFGEVEGPQPRRLRLGDVERAPVRREADAVRGEEGEDQLADVAAIGAGVIHRATVLLAGAHLAQIGEIEPAQPVEHHVVRPLQRPGVAAGVEHLDGAGGEADPLDSAAAVIRRDADRPHPGLVALGRPGEAAVVADVAEPVRADGRAVRATARRGDRGRGPVRGDPGQGAALDLDDEH